MSHSGYYSIVNLSVRVRERERAVRHLIKILICDVLLKIKYIKLSKFKTIINKNAQKSACYICGYLPLAFSKRKSSSFPFTNDLRSLS